VDCEREEKGVLPSFPKDDYLGGVKRKRERDHQACMFSGVRTLYGGKRKRPPYRSFQGHYSRFRRAKKKRTARIIKCMKKRRKDWPDLIPGAGKAGPSSSRMPRKKGSDRERVAIGLRKG